MKLVVASLSLLLMVGCVKVERPLLEVHERPQRVDPARVPPTSSHEEARRELEKAYAYIDSLERDNADLKRDREKYKRERDEYKDRAKRYDD